MQKFITKAIKITLLITLLVSVFTTASFAQVTGGSGQVYMSSCPSLDMDGDGKIQAYVDGIILNRILTLSFSDETILSGVTVGSGAARTTASAMRSFVDVNKSRYDFDNDGQVLAGTDGLYVLRYQLGISEASFMSGININASAASVIGKINSLCALPAMTVTPPVVIPAAPISCPSLDVNGDGKIQTYVDGIILNRIFDTSFASSNILNGVTLDSASTRTSISDMKSFVDTNKSRYDFDGDGLVNADKDMMYVLRYTLGLNGESFLSGINTSASVSSIITKINSLCALPALVSTSAPTACTAVYAPVCGMPKQNCNVAGTACTDVMPTPQTYSNSCMMNAAGATFISNGACGSDTTIKGVQVSLASNQPNEVLLGGSANPMQKLADFVFSGTGLVTDIKLIRTGVSTNQTLTNVYLADTSVTGTQNTLLGNATVQNDGSIYFKNISGLLSLNNSTKTISVKAEIASGHEGESVGVSLQGYALSNNSLTTIQLIGPNLAISGGVTNYCPKNNFTNADCVCPNGQSPTPVVMTTYGIQQYTCDIQTTMCTAIYKPVCGRAKNSCDGMDTKSNTACRPAPAVYTTYSNRCQLDAAGAVFVSEGVCGVDTATTTNTFVSLANTSGFASSTKSPNSAAVKIGSFTLRAPSASAVILKNINIDLTGSSLLTNNQLTNLSVRSDAGYIGLPIGSVTAVSNFNTNMTVASNTTKVFDVYVDIGNYSEGLSVTPSMKIDYTLAANDVMVSAGPAMGVTTRVSSSKIDVSLVSTTSPAQYVLGGTDNFFAGALKFVSTNGVAASLKSLTFSAPTSVTAIKLNGFTSVLVGGQTTIYNPNIQVPADNSGIVTPIFVNVACVGAMYGCPIESPSPMNVTLNSLDYFDGAMIKTLSGLNLATRVVTVVNTIPNNNYETPPYIPTIPGTPTPVCIEPTVNVGVGSRGQAVTDVQKFLNSNGYLANTPTGYFGSATRAAVIKFQTENGINSTGFVGQLTRAQLKVKSCEPLIPIPDTPVETSATSMPVTSSVQAITPNVPASATVVSSINVVAVAPGFSVSSTAVENGNKFTIVFNALNITFDAPHYLKVVYKNSGKSCILTASFVPVAAKTYNLIRSSESACILGGTIGDLSEIDHIEIVRQ